MIRFHQFAAAFALALIAVVVLTHFPAFADDVVVTPGGAAVVPEGTNIVVPWGAWLSDLASTLGVLIFGVITWGLRKLPANIVAILKTVQAEQLLQKAIDYGVNATAHAAKDETLTVPVGNAVIASAVEYAVQNGAPTVVRWLGGENGIVQKIIARLDIEPAAEATSVPGTSMPLAVAPVVKTSPL